MTLGRKGMLALLIAISAHTYIDRVALGLLLEEIKHDLSLSDTQLGLLTGIAFSLFYSLMGIPLARFADRGRHGVLLYLTISLWSLAVAGCGLATSFVQLAACRITAAVGEAGCIPASHSLIAERFSRSERPSAVGSYMLYAPIGFLLGYGVTGYLNVEFGWRWTFVILAAPGIVLALAAKLFIKDHAPGSRLSPGSEDTPSDSDSLAPPIKTVFSDLVGNATFFHLLLSLVGSAFFGYGIFQWLPTYFIRSFHMEAQEVGLWFAILLGGGGIAGTWLGGVLAMRYANENEELQLKGVAAANVLYMLFSIGVYSTPSPSFSLLCLAVVSIGGCLTSAPVYSIIQLIVASRMRATAVAIIFLLSNLLGMGLGPLAVGMLSDALGDWAGPESLRFALVLMMPGYLWPAWHVWRASKSVRRDCQGIGAMP